MLIRITIVALAFLLAGQRLDTSNENLLERSENIEAVTAGFVQSEVVRIPASPQRSHKLSFVYPPFPETAVSPRRNSNSSLILFIRRFQI